MIERIKGTYDLLNTQWIDYIYTTLKKQMTLFGYHEIMTPLLEPTSLFRRSLGNYTDVVSKEMFLIAPHPNETGREEPICLRPEMTASIVRAYLQEGVQKRPWNVYSYGPCFRYERPQKGRFRQFHQWTIESIGTSSLLSDVQLLIMLNDLFRTTYQLEQIELGINFLGCMEDRQQYRQLLKNFLENHQATICSTCHDRTTNNTLRVFDCKSSICQELYRTAPLLSNHLCSSCHTEWEQIRKQLQQQRVPWVHWPLLVRGLDYYEKIVFEFVSQNLGAQSTFCGGGRYELATILGAKQVLPSVGAAIGIERLSLMLQAQYETIPGQKQYSRWALLPTEEEFFGTALTIAQELRKHAIPITLSTDRDSLKAMLRWANNENFDGVLIYGHPEVAAGVITYKDLHSGIQTTHTVETLIAHYQLLISKLT